MTATGKFVRELYAEGQALMYFATRDDGKELCALAVGKAGHYTVVGFDLQGKVAWEYPLPTGEYLESLRRIQSVELPDGTPAWLVTAANGSLHWLAEDGKLIDRFDCGAILTGVSMETVGDQTILFISTADQLTAWQVESPTANSKQPETDDSKPSEGEAESEGDELDEPASSKSEESSPPDSLETDEG